MDEEEIVSVPFEDTDLEDDEPVYRTYGMDFDHMRVRGMVDGKEAVMQSIWKILNTVRFSCLIYDDQYGCDIFNKINENDLSPAFLESDMPKMVEEALLYDERITGVDNFSYEILTGDSVHVTFTASTIYGELDVEGVITDGSD